MNVLQGDLKTLHGVGQVRVRLDPEVRLTWDWWDARQSLSPSESMESALALPLPRPELPDQSLIIGRHPSTGEAQFRSQPVTGRLYVGEVARLDEVKFLVINGPKSPHLSRPIGEPNGRRGMRAARLQVSEGNWLVRLDAEPQERLTHNYDITHFGSLQRTDRRTMSLKSAETVLHRLLLGLSFMRGARAGLLLPVGMRDGKAVGALFAHPSVESSVHRPMSWYSRQIDSKLIESLLASVMSLQPKAQRDEVTLLALSYVLQALKPPVEAGLAHAMAGLEYLADDDVQGAWAANPVNRGRRWANAPAYETVGLLGDKYRLPGTVDDVSAVKRQQGPVQVAAAASRRQRLIAPVAWARNQHLHGKAVRRHTYPNSMWIQSWMLSSEWLTLAVLKRLGYSGPYWSRLGRLPKFDWDMRDLK